MNKGNTLDHRCKCPYCGEEYGHKCGRSVESPGDGYRFLKHGEAVLPLDEVFVGYWAETQIAGDTLKIGNNLKYRRRIDPPKTHKDGCSAKCDCKDGAAIDPILRPLFEQRAGATIARVTSTFGTRGTEYGDTMRDCQWLKLLAVAKELGYTINPKHARAIAIAAMGDIKYQRFQGGYKDDHFIDGIAYDCFEADEMRELLGGVK